MTKIFVRSLFLALAGAIPSTVFAQYVAPTPYSQARCRWESLDRQTVHMYEGPRSPGFEVSNVQDCGLGIRALILIMNGRYANFSSFDGALEFRSADGKITKCLTKTVLYIPIDNHEPLLEYSGASRARAATAEQLRELSQHLEQHIQVNCQVTDDLS